MTIQILGGRAFTFRRAVLSALGIYVAGKGLLQHDWISLLLGVAILAFGWLSPG